MVGAAFRIARAEWTRHHRDVGRPWLGRPTVLIASLALTILLGALAHVLGRNLASGQTVPRSNLSILTIVTFVWMVWRSSQLIHLRFERLHPDFLLTTVPARTAAMGLLGFVSARLAVSIALPTVGVAAGTALGLRSPVVTVTVLISIAGLAALAVVLGTTGRLAAHLVGLHLVRARFYRDLLTVFGWLPLLAGWLLIEELSVSVAALGAVFGALPSAWFVDLALVGGDPALASVRRGVGALGLLVPTVPLLTAMTIVLARRIWETTPVSSTESHGSHSLVHDGWLEQLLGDRVSRPVRTVARERWLMERRVPRGLLSTGYVFVVVGVFGFPALLSGGPNGFLLLIAVSLGLAVGIAFASVPIGTEYRALPMLFTTVSGAQFVGGLLLAVTLVGVPLVTLITIPVGIVSLVGGIQTVFIAMAGVASCVCSGSVALAVGMGVERYDYVPVPSFFTDVPVFAELGRNGFLRLGVIFGVVLLANLPAYLGNAPLVYEGIAAVGPPPLVVQVGSLLVTIVLATAVSNSARRIAVRRYQNYQFD